MIENKNIRISKLFLFLISIPFLFMFSLVLVESYTLGDQFVYRTLYDQLRYVNFWDIQQTTKYWVSARDPISGLILWLGANMNINKDIYISLLNILLLCGLVLLLNKYRAPWYFYLIILSNFYIIVLLTSAERLKISYIFLTYAALFQGKFGFFLLIISPLAHIQSLLIIACLIVKHFRNNIILVFSGKITKQFIYFFVITSLLCLLTYFFYYEHIFNKLTALYKYNLIEFSYKNAVPTFILILLGSYIVKSWSLVTMSLLPLLFCSIFLGDSRVNMISITLFFYILLVKKYLNNPLVIILFIYFSLKTIPFVKNIFLNGSGFKGFLF